MKNIIRAYEFLERFPNAKAARLHLEQRRWHGCPSCPYCGSKERIQTRKVEGFYRCLSCKNDFTVRTGTIFERSHVSLDKWLYAIYLLVNSYKGISSMQLSKEIGVTQKTAWYMLQRLREAEADSGLLSTICEVDETYISGDVSLPMHERRIIPQRKNGTILLKPKNKKSSPVTPLL
jgi:transposase-like protein